MTQSILDQELQVDADKNYYEEYTKEGGKFYDPDPDQAKQKVARAKFESDLFIERLKRENAEARADAARLRDESSTRARLEELIDHIENRTTQPLTPQEKPILSEAAEKTEVDFDKLISQKIREAEIQKRYDANADLVKSKLKERFGNNYASIVKEQIDELGLSEDEFNRLARQNPTVLFKTLGVDKVPENFQAPPRSSNTSIANKGPKERTWAYYQELKKANPKMYLEPKVMNQMYADYERLGAQFEDGDFNTAGFR